MNARGGNWKVHGCFLAVLLFLLVGGTRAHSNGNARGDLGAMENGRNIENALNNEMIDELSEIKRSEEDDMVCHEIDDCETCLGNGNCGWCDYGTVQTMALWIHIFMRRGMEIPFPSVVFAVSLLWLCCRIQ